MIRLRLLGTPAVEGGDGPLGGAPAQRKSLALLALLAVGGDRGVTRDKLLAYLWPEAEADRAAHRLTQALYALRRATREDALFLGSGDLRLNAEFVSSDVAEFHTARHAGDLARAAALYGGPFLDGFFLSGAPEFERWADNERTGFARDFGETLETLAAGAAARGDHRSAADWWRRLADHEPLSSRVTVHLMYALAAAGSRAEALQQARRYQELMREELEAAPSPAVLSLAERLRSPASASPTAPSHAPVTIAVLPFANLTADGDNDYFAEGLAEEVMRGLAQVEVVRVAARSSACAAGAAGLDARDIGRRLSVRALVEGSVRQVRDRVRLSAQLVDTRDGCQLWSEAFERTVDDVFSAQDELAAAIVRALDAPLRRLASGAVPAAWPAAREQADAR